MEIAVRTRHLDIPAELREAATEKANNLQRFLEGTQRAEILFSRDHAARDDGYVSCEVVIVARGRFVRARASGHLASDALEAAINKEALRLTRMKGRLVQRSRPRHGTLGQRPTELPG
ncbi:MAG TPA: HPF/RaiA family ribosome-associated protein [Acidimicrobiales bacterium]|nr:HPF/RaiA family ribosome-associated protein [Acidimicrobiales bacterium]